MRIDRVSLATLALALGVSAKDAYAGDVSVSSATTTPLQTSAPDNVSPGNVAITSSGSITVTANQSAVTVNSSNNVNNSGTIASNNANNSNGIVITGGNFSGNVVTVGTLNLLEDFTGADSDNDGDFDGPFAQGTARNGIWLQSGGVFTGGIAQTGGAINIEGTNSSGVRLDGRLVGNLDVDGGTITVVGDNTFGMNITGGAAGGVTGDVSASGITARGGNAIGVNVDAPIGGALVLGTVSASGYRFTNRITDATALSRLDADDTLQGGAAVRVQSSIGSGVTVFGIGVEDDVDDDGDGVTEASGDTNDDVTGALATAGSAPALHIRPSATTPSNVVIGAAPGTVFGVLNRGAITANGLLDGVESSAIRIEGSGGATVSTAGGFRNDGNIGAVAFEANTYGVYVGSGATVPTIENRKNIGAIVNGETGVRNATGIFIASGGNVSAVRNSGILGAQLFGETGNAIAIVDQSNTLATITNSGTLQAQVIATDSDATDNVVPVVTGSSIAIDTSASTIGVTINQIADTPFNDDDTVDDDATGRPAVQILGAVRLGSGADVMNLLAGKMEGDISFGAGADSFTINNGATYAGRLSDSDGQLNINVANGQLQLNGGVSNITSANFAGQSVLNIQLGNTPAETARINASGNVTFAAGSVVNPLIPAGLPVSGSHVFLTAGTLTGASNVTRTVSGVNAPFLYNIAIVQTPNNANSLQIDFVQKTTAQLGLNANEAAAFDPIIAALRTDATASTALSALDTQGEFLDAYDDLLPNFASAAAELATTAIQQSQSATSNRLSAIRVRDVRDVSVWAQEIGYGLTRDPETFGVAYDGYGFGIAAGIDGPLNNGGLFGLSISFITSEVTEPGRKDGQLSSAFGQLNAYYGASLGPLNVDIIAGAGVGRETSERFVNIGAFEQVAEAEWMAYEGHGSIKLSAPARLTNWLVVSPQAALTYVTLNEEAYEEEGGGVINLNVDSTTSQRLWGDVGLEVTSTFGRAGATIIAPRVMVGYRANLIDEAAERTMRFAAAGNPFTLTDESTGEGAPIVGVGFDTTNGYSTFSLSYEGELGDQLQRHSLNAAVRIRF